MAPMPIEPCDFRSDVIVLVKGSAGPPLMPSMHEWTRIRVTIDCSTSCDRLDGLQLCALPDLIYCFLDTLKVSWPSTPLQSRSPRPCMQHLPSQYF